MSNHTAQAAGEGMSEERLAEICAAAEQYRGSPSVRRKPNGAIAHRAELLAEVERLRDLNAELGETLDVRHDETQQLRARLAEIGETRESEPCDTHGWRDCKRCRQRAERAKAANLEDL